MTDSRELRRLLWIVGGGLLLFAAILGVVLLKFQTSGIPQAAFDKIKNGMTIVEVEAMLGPPTRTRSSKSTTNGVPIVGTFAEWKRGSTVIVVNFDDAERVLSSNYRERSFIEALGDKVEALTGWN